MLKNFLHIVFFIIIITLYISSVYLGVQNDQLQNLVIIPALLILVLNIYLLISEPVNKNLCLNDPLINYLIFLSIVPLTLGFFAHYLFLIFILGYFILEIILPNFFKKIGKLFTCSKWNFKKQNIYVKTIFIIWYILVPISIYSFSLFLVFLGLGLSMSSLYKAYGFELFLYFFIGSVISVLLMMLFARMQKYLFALIKPIAYTLVFFSLSLFMALFSNHMKAFVLSKTLCVNTDDTFSIDLSKDNKHSIKFDLSQSVIEWKDVHPGCIKVYQPLKIELYYKENLIQSFFSTAKVDLDDDSTQKISTDYFEASVLPEKILLSVKESLGSENFFLESGSGILFSDDRVYYFDSLYLPNKLDEVIFTSANEIKFIYRKGALPKCDLINECSNDVLTLIYNKDIKDVFKYIGTDLSILDTVGYFGCDNLDRFLYDKEALEYCRIVELNN